MYVAPACTVSSVQDAARGSPCQTLSRYMAYRETPIPAPPLSLGGVHFISTRLGNSVVPMLARDTASGAVRSINRSRTFVIPLPVPMLQPLMPGIPVASPASSAVSARTPSWYA